MRRCGAAGGGAAAALALGLVLAPVGPVPLPALATARPEPPGASPGPPAIRFREVSAAWGLAFRHRHGGSGRYYQPETDGSGVVLFDFDGDGDLDVFFVDSGDVPGTGGEPSRSRLLRNDGLPGDVRFVDVTERSGIAVAGYGMGAVSGDVDGDGDLDLYVTAFGRNQLFENQGDGTFADVTEASSTGEPRWSASAAFADVDRDGDLDLYVTNYLVWSLAEHRVCSDPATGTSGYCHPALLPGEPDTFYRNRGDGTFEDRTVEAGFGAADGKGLGVAYSDFDGDGWPDLYVANDTTANFFFRNRGDGTFEDLSLISGTAFSDRTLPEAGMGVAVGDLWSDGRPDIYVTNYALETNALYRNRGDGLFVDARHLAGVAEPSIPVLGFGAAFADFDQDGDLDLAVANGHILDTIEEIHAGLTYAQRNQILEQVRPGRFEELADAGVDVVRVSRGLATGDLDGDGDLDLAITNSNDLAEIYANVGEPLGGWALVDLALARGGNTAGIGARLAVVPAGGDRQAAEVVTGTSYLSQSAVTLHFGLGAAAVFTLELELPGGGRRRLVDLPTDRRYRLAG